MQRYKLVISYDGTSYYGWQKQSNVPTVQDDLEKILKTLLGYPVVVYGSGRTDKGVHASGQVAHIDSLYIANTKKLIQGVNHFGRKTGISLLSIEPAKSNFHARFLANKRTYTYFILNRMSICPFWEKYAWHIRTPLLVDKMQEAALNFIGQHDFTSFRDTHCQAKSPIKCLDSFLIEKEEDIIRATIKAPSFLHHQVRIMMGTLVDIGQKKYAPTHIKTVLLARDRTKSGITAPAQGLFLKRVDYPTT